MGERGGLKGEKGKDRKDRRMERELNEREKERVIKKKRKTE